MTAVFCALCVMRKNVFLYHTSRPPPRLEPSAHSQNVASPHLFFYKINQKVRFKNFLLFDLFPLIKIADGSKIKFKKSL